MTQLVEATPAALREAQRALRAAGAQLRERCASQTLDLLCALIDCWRDPNSGRRVELLRALPEASGFHPATVREGLARGLDHWSGDAFREAVQRELGSLARRTDPSMVSGFDLTGVVLAGSIPMPSLLSLLLPLALHSPVLAKCATRDQVTAPLVAASLADCDPLLGRCLAVTSFSRKEEDCAAVFLEADCVVASGSDESLARIAAQLKAPRPQLKAPPRLVGYGHRMSVALLGPEACTGTELAETARGLALDTALWDQQGCLSPLAVFVEDPDGRTSARVAAALAEAMAAAEKEWPRGEIDPADAAAIVHERDVAEMRAAGGRPVRLYASRDTSWSVVLEEDTTWRTAPLQRFLRVQPLRERVSEHIRKSPQQGAQLGGRLDGGLGAQQLPAFAPLGPHLASVAVAGFGPATKPLAQALGQLGASRVCAPGTMQSPPLGWHRDGQPLLLPLARIADLESLASTP